LAVGEHPIAVEGCVGELLAQKLKSKGEGWLFIPWTWATVN
jgi:hypothetical protein